MAGNLTEQTYLLLRNKLARGKLLAGVRLSSRGMAKEMGVSLTPVRGAFDRLISEGLLEHHTGLGVFVPNPDRRGLEEIYEFREILECAAVAKICGRLSGATISEIERCLEKEAALEELFARTDRTETDFEVADSWRINDEAFHLALLRAAGNRRVLETVSNLRAGAHIIYHTFRSEQQLEPLRRTRKEHRRILDALLSGDENEARQVMAEHIRYGCQLAMDAHSMRHMQEPHASRLHAHSPT